MSELPVEINCQSVHQKLNEGEDFLFLDCRESTEYDTAHIKGTTLLPMSEIQDRVGELEEYKQSLIVVHCHHGGRSLRVTHWLRSQGFANVQNLTGGIDAWSQTIDNTVPRY